jgi:hypothetical protein
MKQNIIRYAMAALVAAGLAPSRAHAAMASNYTTSGQPFTWGQITPDLPLTYDIDTGGFGNLTHVQAEAMINQAFQQWQSIPTANLLFHRVSGSDVLAFTGSYKHVTVANVDQFLFGGGAPIEVTIPVLLDTNGSIIDHYFGNGASLDIVGATGILQSTPDGTLNQEVIILNDRAVDGQPDPDDLTMTDETRAIMQTIGQVLGVQNSDLNDELFFDGDPTNNTAIPIIDYGADLNSSITWVVGGGLTPTLEDQMSVSTLYPSDKFSTSTGTITGSVLLADGVTGLQGIDVIARKVGDLTNSAVSAVSGSAFQVGGARGRQDSSGSRDPKLRGAYEIHAVPGTYILEYRPVRQPIGPRWETFPLPGGRQFYTSSGSTTDPTAATPVTVTAGASTQVNLIASGKPAPASQAITAVTTPHDTAQTAQSLPLSASLTGHVKQSISGTPGQVVEDQRTTDSAGTIVRFQDKVEDLYRIQVPEASIVTLRLAPAKTNVDLDLYLLSAPLGGPNTPLVAASAIGVIGNSLEPETLQVAVDAGDYYIGVSAADVPLNPDGTPKSAPQETDYTLDLVTTPLGDQTPPTRPIHDQFVAGNVTDTSVDVSWVTDVDAASDVLAGPLRQEVGDPTPTKLHHLTVKGLTPSSIADLAAISQDANANRDSIPKVYFQTADTAAATGPAKLQAQVVGTVEDLAGGGGHDLDSLLVEVAIRNIGGPASSVLLTSLAPSAGWKLVTPFSQPLTIGGIGTNGTALVVVRLVPQDPTSTTPMLATLTGGGTLAGAGGATDNWTISP